MSQLKAVNRQGDRKYAHEDEGNVFILNFFKQEIENQIENCYLNNKPAKTVYQCHSKYVNHEVCRCFSSAEKQLVETIGEPGFVIGSSAPPFVWESAYHCARKYKAKFIAEFRDIWPLSLIEIQGTNPHHPFVLLLSQIEKRAYRRADAIVSTMPYAREHVCSVSGVPCEKVFWMPNGINTAEIDRQLAEGIELPPELDAFLSSHWCGVYTGSLAKCEHVDYLLDVFSHIEDPGIFLVLIGEGGEKEHLCSLAQEKGLTNVRFFPAVSKMQVHAVLGKAGCCLAAMPDMPILRFGLSKYKLSDYLYSGAPVIFACSAQSVVKDAGQFALPYGDPAEMAKAIMDISRMGIEERSALGERSRELIREQYDFSVIGEHYLSLLEELEKN